MKIIAQILSGTDITTATKDRDGRKVTTGTVKLLTTDPSQIIDVALKSGLESVQRIQYGVRDETRYLNQVRQQAIEDSKSKANELAKAYTMTLGKVYSIQYNTTMPQHPMVMGKMMMAEAAPADSYIADDIRFSDNVSVVFNLE